MTMKTSDDLQKYLNQKDLDAKLLNLDSPVRTVEEAANSINTRKDKIIKSLVFITDEKPVLSIINGENEVSSNKIKEEFNTETCNLASPKKVKEITGYPVGSVPPISLEIPKIVDNQVVQKNYVYGGGGSEHHLLKIAPGDILLETKSLISDIKNKK